MSNQPLEPRHLRFVQDLVHQEAGMALEANQDYLLDLRLHHLARENDFKSVAQLLDHLSLRPFGPLHQQMVEALTTNETRFFRDPRMFDFLRQQILPELFEQAKPHEQFQFWSAACSSGQEPYSLAMLLHEHFPAYTPQVKMIATDINQQMLKKAIRGQYAQIEINSGLPANYLIKYFHQEGLFWQIDPKIQHIIKFELHNLLHSPQWSQRSDLILIRNILIYLTPQARRRVLKIMLQQLKPQGYLIVGSAESLLHDGLPVELVRESPIACCYQRVKS